MSAMKLMPRPGPDIDQKGMSRSNAFGRILYFESLMRRRQAESRTQRYVRLHNYYINQNLPPDNVDQPLLIDIFKTIVDKHLSYLWGQWNDKRLIGIRVTPFDKDDMTPEALEEATAYGRKIKRYLEKVYDQNRLNKVLWKAAKNAGEFGDGVLEVSYAPDERRIVIEPVQPEYFHCMWEISNMTKLTEVMIAYPIDRLTALEQWGSTGNDQFIGYQAVNPDYAPGFGVIWKHWTSTSFQVWIDENCRINEKNPYMPLDAEGNVYPGIIPFIHVPNMQAGAEYWGFSDAEFILQLQDELNRRLADAGDLVNTHAHPIFVLRNFSGEGVELTVGPDALWDAGKDGEVERLDGMGPAPEVMAYIDKIEEMISKVACVPQTAFGHQKGGTSHQSGLALAMAMMPIVERSKEKRIYWSDALKDLFKMIFYMTWVRDPALLVAAGLDYERVKCYDIEPIFADILPKEELQDVNEAVATYANGLRSLPKALEKLGEEDIQTEVARIKEDMLFKASVAKPTPPAGGGPAGQNSDNGMGGSADLPGGIGAGAGKPGTLIKSDELPQLDNLSMSQEAG